MGRLELSRRRRAVIRRVRPRLRSPRLRRGVTAGLDCFKVDTSPSPGPHIGPLCDLGHKKLPEKLRGM